MTLPHEESPATREAAEFAAALNLDDIPAFLDAIQRRGIADAGPPHSGPDPVELPDPLVPIPLLRVRVDLDGATPPIWRRLEVRGDLSVETLHEVLQIAMGWTDSHLHRFWVGPTKQIWTGPYLLTDLDVEEGEDGTHESTVELSQLLRTVGDRLFYTYDYGDGWNHTIKLEAVDPCPEDQPPAVCTGGRNACPPEDVGGAHSHNELVSAFREAPDRSTMDPQYVQWLPPDWDPLAFDPAEATVALALVGTDLTDMLDQLDGIPALRPALLSLLERLPRSEAARHTAALSQDVAVVEDAAPLDSAPLDSALLDVERMTKAVAPWQLLLNLAGREAIPLTGAGWLKPSIVQQIYADLDMGREWIGKGNREDMTLPVFQLRESAMRLGLLRKHKDRLLVTPRGRAVTGDPGALWRYLSERVIPGDDQFTNDIAVLFLLRFAHGDATPMSAASEVGADLVMAGWPSNAVGAHEDYIDQVCRDVQLLIARLSGARRFRGTGDVQVARAFALTALCG